MKDLFPNEQQKKLLNENKVLTEEEILIKEKRKLL